MFLTKLMTVTVVMVGTGMLGMGTGTVWYQTQAGEADSTAGEGKQILLVQKDGTAKAQPPEWEADRTQLEREKRLREKLTKALQEAERNSLNFKRSVYVVKDIKAGESFTKENIRVIRPGDGLHPRYYDWLIGKKANKELKFGNPLKLNDLI